MLAKLTEKLKYKTYEIPKGWSYLPISEIIDINSGFAFKSTDNCVSGVKWLKIANVGHGKVLWEEISYLPSDYLNKYVSFSLNEGDIVVALTRPILNGKLKVARVSSKDMPSLLNQRVGKVVNKIELDIDFLFQLLQFNNLSAQINYFLSGTDPPNLNNNVLDLVFIYLPTQKECSHIAQLLSTWDKAIETTQNLIATKEQLKKGLMQQLLTGKKRLPGFNSEWKKVRIGDVVKEVKRPIEWNDDKLYDLISVRRRSVGVFYRESLYGHQILTKGLFTTKAGDFLISKMQIVHGASGMVKKEHDGMFISGSYISLHSKDESKLNIEFFDWLSKTPEFYHLCFTSSYGVHIEKMTFDFQDFLHRQIVIPTDIKEQESIVKVLNTLIKEIDLLKTQLELYRQQKKGLMQVLLTGAVRVKL